MRKVNQTAYEIIENNLNIFFLLFSMVSAAGTGLWHCIEQLNKLNELDKKLIETVYRNSEYLQNLCYALIHSNDCSFWFSNYGNYTRISSPDERGYELTKLISIDYNDPNDLDERQRKMSRIIGSLFVTPPFYENPLVPGIPNDLQKKVLKLYFDAMILYAALAEDYIKLVDTYLEKQLSAEPLWNVKTKKVYGVYSPILYRSLKPSGELSVGFVWNPENWGVKGKEVIIGGKAYQYNSLQIEDTQLNITCGIIILQGAKGKGYKIACEHFTNSTSSSP